MSILDENANGVEAPPTELEASPQELCYLVYASMLSPGVDPAGVDAIVAQAKIANAARGVTGMVLYDHGSILQIMEGEPAVVDALFTKIKQDPRHRHIIKLVEEPIDHRSFHGWSLARPDVTWNEVAQLDTYLNDFFLNGVSFVNLEPGRAKDILMSFRKGRWHQAD